MSEQIPYTSTPVFMPEAVAASSALREREQRSIPVGRVAGTLLLSAALLASCGGDKAPNTNPSAPASAAASAEGAIGSACNDGLAEGSVHTFRASERVQVRELGTDSFEEVFGGTGGMLPVMRPTTRGTTKATTPRTVAPPPAATKPASTKPAPARTTTTTPSPAPKPTRTKTSAPTRGGGVLTKVAIVEVESVDGPCRIADIPQSLFMENVGLPLPPAEGDIFMLREDIDGRIDTPD